MAQSGQLENWKGKMKDRSRKRTILAIAGCLVKLLVKWLIERIAVWESYGSHGRKGRKRSGQRREQGVGVSQCPRGSVSVYCCRLFRRNCWYFCTTFKMYLRFCRSVIKNPSATCSSISCLTVWSGHASESRSSFWKARSSSLCFAESLLGQSVSEVTGSYAVALSFTSGVGVGVTIGNFLLIIASSARLSESESVGHLPGCLGGLLVSLGILNPSASVLGGDLDFLRLTWVHGSDVSESVSLRSGFFVLLSGAVVLSFGWFCELGGLDCCRALVCWGGFCRLSDCGG